MFLQYAIKKPGNVFIFPVLVGMSLLLPGISYAHDCKVDFSTNYLEANTTFVENLNVGDKVGDVIFGGVYDILKCNNTSGISSQELVVVAKGVYNPMSFDGRVVYPTGITGLGFAFGAYSPTCNAWGWASRSAGSMSGTVCKKTNGAYGNTIKYQPVVQLYKIAAGMGAGSVNSLIVGGANVRINEVITGGSPLTYLKLNIKAKPCNVTTKNITVQMGKIKPNDFDGLSTVAKTETGFAIGLNCSYSSPVSLQIDGTSSNPKAGILNTSRTSYPQAGVGVQILDANGNPFPLQTPVSQGVRSGVNNISLKARYIQTGSVITPGKADANATFTITYK